MAVSFSNLQPRLLASHLPPKRPVTRAPPSSPILLLSASAPSPFSAGVCLHRNLHRCLFVVKSSSVDGFYSQNAHKRSEADPIPQDNKLSSFIQLLRSILPGGSWWNLSDQPVEVIVGAKPVTVWLALHRMWQLVATDRWVIFVAFASLSLAAIAEISIPHFLTASIFTAQSAQTAVFKRNVVLLVLFCVASAICSGLRGGFFGIANMILAC